MKGEKMAQRSSIGSIVRKRLSDISNTQSQHKLGGIEEKHPQVHNSTEMLINQLLTEKTTLVKVIDERNKIIELSGKELRNLRTSYQKLQLQNLKLAQSNSHMLAELNLGREKLKALQHELLCKDALLKAKNLELEVGADKKTTTVSQEGEKVAEESSQKDNKVVEESSQKDNSNVKPCNRTRRRPARSQSMGSATTHQVAAEKEKVESKRRCLRRQSARFKSQEREPTENLFEIELEDAKVQENGQTQFADSCCPRTEEAQASSSSRRASMGRPSRRATVKVQSYKEVPLNAKMRRNE